MYYLLTSAYTLEDKFATLFPSSALFFFQGHPAISDVFRFVTFYIFYALVLLQLVLSTVSDTSALPNKAMASYPVAEETIPLLNGPMTNRESQERDKSVRWEIALFLIHSFIDE